VPHWVVWCKIATSTLKASLLLLLVLLVLLVLLLLLCSQVSNVKLSKRLASTPAVVVASKWGQSAHMERIMKASVRFTCWGEGGACSYQVC
jgi:hypothetical protein